MWRSLSQRQEWLFFASLPKADAVLAAAWWVVLVLRGVLPVLFALAMGAPVRRSSACAPAADVVRRTW